MIAIISFTESSCNCIMGLIIYSIEGKWKYYTIYLLLCPFLMEHFLEETAPLRFEFLTLLVIWVNVLITDQSQNVPLYKEPAKWRNSVDVLTEIYL